MKRRLALRDRAVWVIAAVALAAVLHLVLPIWVLVAAVVLLVGVPVFVRRRKYHRAHR